MNMKFLSFVLLVCGTFPFVFSESLFQESVRSNIFEPLRPKHLPKTISACHTRVTEPYGLLVRTFKRGQVPEGASCNWTLHAPANHVVNVISMGFDLLDDIPSEKGSPDGGSTIDLYDSAAFGATPSNALDSYSVASNAHAGSVLRRTTSSKQDMFVTITYRDIPGYATQKALIKYEFLNVDDMNRLLKTDNVKPKST